MASTKLIKPFHISIRTAEVDRLSQQIRTTRHPTQDVVPGAKEDYGFPTSWALDLMHYWRDNYAWEQAEEDINAFRQFTTDIEALKIHFVHQRSSQPDAKPILLIHGWPGSFYEFSKVIWPLCNGKPGFHCVVPSLPGFCFSSSPPKGWSVKDTARVFHTLRLRLGYREYAVQAGDWGQFVARELGANPKYAPKHCKAVHLNYCPGALLEELQDADLTEREKEARAKGIDWRTNHVGYAVLMRTRPHSVGWMLQDNPIGLLSFIGEKYYEASNPARTLDSDEWKEHILTTISLYHFTNCIMSSALIYYENTPHHLFASYAIADENKIRCPLGYSSYMFDTAPNSRRAVGRAGNLVLYKERDYARHFACLEDPQGVVEDVRELVTKYW